MGTGVGREVGVGALREAIKGKESQFLLIYIYKIIQTPRGNRALLINIYVFGRWDVTRQYSELEP